MSPVIRFKEIDGLHFSPKGEWRAAVVSLSGNACEICGKTERLNAHHIVPVTCNQNLCSCLENGASLCYFHHLQAHKDGFCKSKLLPQRENANDLNEVEMYLQNTIRLIVPKGQKQAIEAAAKAAGESVNLFTQRALLARMGLKTWPERPTDPIDEEK